eukprot:Nitzschia sp. Nitz4//scaffold321_size20361//3889//6051//NITZ4_008682-RA/size20361-processed-gene-0.34-mRNA-1//-1//CDS//3329547772//5021//frame0
MTDPSLLPKDEEGLLLEYDVVICGTGLVQAILASALARAGKTVLHCDGDDLYGELDAVWSISQLMEKKEQNNAESIQPSASVDSSENHTSIPLHTHGTNASLEINKISTTTKIGIKEGSNVKTPYGTGTVQALPESDAETPSVSVSLDKWCLADGKAPTCFFGIDASDWIGLCQDPMALEDYLLEKYQIEALGSKQAEDLLKSRQVALDVAPAFILAAGRAVDGMLASNVADYLEFKSVEGLLWFDDNRQGILSRVPCSKSDVFSTKLLAPLDKRRLMKFLQLAMDYATQLSAAEELLKYQQQQAESVDTVNPNDVVSGEMEDVKSLNERHLNQGRSLARPQNKAVATNELNTLQECMQKEGFTLDEYLSIEHKLSPKLRAIIRYALAMETASPSVSLSQGMSQLRRHLQALGRYGTTAFLMPMYGSGELSQAFCRSAAVFGATYLLRRAPVAIQLCDGELQGVTIAGDMFVDGDQTTEPSESSTKTVKCKHVVVSANALPLAKTEPPQAKPQRMARLMALFQGTLLEGEQRHVIIIPPGTLGNNPHAIHGIVLDQSVHVVPANSTLLHLTTTLEEDTDESILVLAVEAITKAGIEAGLEPAQQVLSTSFSHDLCSPADKDPQIAGVHVCSTSGQTLTADVAFEQAERLFHTICPGAEFLGLSADLDKAIKERVGSQGHDDEERLMLESALGMIADTTDEAESSEPATEDNPVPETPTGN